MLIVNLEFHLPPYVHHHLNEIYLALDLSPVHLLKDSLVKK